MSIVVIEDAIIAQVKALLGNKIKTADSLPADFDEDSVRRMLIDAPAVYVSFGGGAPGGPGGTTAEILARWGVFAVTGHASGQAARRRGDSQHVGAYEIMETLVPGLHGLKVPNEGTLSLIAVENLFNGAIERQGLSVYSAVFQMPMAWPSDANLSLLTPFASFDSKIDMAPKDGRTDAEDLVALPL